jgi:hypothetical protein
MVLQFSPQDRAILERISEELHAEGWASHVTVERLLGNWKLLAGSADNHPLTVDDYTNDLTGRDALELVLAKCHAPDLRGAIREFVERADAEFLARTHDDTEHALGRYFKIHDGSGWWWKRKPNGPHLAKDLSSTATSQRSAMSLPASGR